MINNINPLIEKVDIPSIAVGAGIGVLGGFAIGSIIDYFRHNRKLYKTADILKSAYIKDHKNDYSKGECKNEALSYISSRNLQIEELTTLISEKQEELHDLNQQISLSRLGNLSPETIHQLNYKIRVLRSEIETLQKSRTKCKSEMILMKNYLLTKKWENIRSLLILKDAEEFSASYISKNKSHSGAGYGSIIGLPIGILASVLMCL